MCLGAGLTIPVAQMAYNDVTHLLTLMSSTQHDTYIHMSDGDVNDVMDEYDDAMWVGERMGQRVVAAVLWVLATYRLWEW